MAHNAQIEQLIEAIRVYPMDFTQTRTELQFEHYQNTISRSLMREHLPAEMHAKAEAALIEAGCIYAPKAADADADDESGIHYCSHGIQMGCCPAGCDYPDDDFLISFVDEEESEIPADAFDLLLNEQDDEDAEYAQLVAEAANPDRPGDIEDYSADEAYYREQNDRFCDAMAREEEIA